MMPEATDTGTHDSTHSRFAEARRLGAIDHDSQDFNGTRARTTLCVGRSGQNER
jgi:hypothetical protein